MRFLIFIFFFFSTQILIAQETYTPTKIKENETGVTTEAAGKKEANSKNPAAILL